MLYMYAMVYGLYMACVVCLMVYGVNVLVDRFGAQIGLYCPCGVCQGNMVSVLQVVWVMVQDSKWVGDCMCCVWW